MESSRDFPLGLAVLVRNGVTLSITFLCLTVTARALAESSTVAFPGALGQGAAALGGRGGDVYRVTNLEDYNSAADAEKIPGSLRHAIRSAEGPRTIVFDVAGVIWLKAPLEVLKSRITIAGQTSPGGITLAGYPLEVSSASDVVIRYLRVRLGDFRARAAHEGDAFAPFVPGTANAVAVGPDCQRIILDHISASWGIDETLSVTNSRDVTVQHCIISESLNRSLHPKGPHGFGSLIRGVVTAEDQASGRGGYTFFGNLWAHHRARNPSIGGQQRLAKGATEASRLRTDINLVNNVIFDWGDAPTHRSQHGQVRIHLVGNSYIAGPSKAGKYIFRENEAAPTFLYHEGNALDGDQDGDHNPSRITAADREAFRDFDEQDQLAAPPDSPPFAFYACIEPAVRETEGAYHNVLAAAGASLWRDSVDRRIVAEIAAREGAILDSPETLRDASGALPGIDDLVTRHIPQQDTDGDGLPDERETALGLNPHDAQDGADLHPDHPGYTHLEVYLDQLTRAGPAPAATLGQATPAMLNRPSPENLK